ncbi:nuclear transport factor 2 family protein [Gordonia sp. NPDC003425]
MSTDPTPADRALAALDALVAVFAANDEHAYFGSFAPDAQLVFPDTAQVSITVEQYRTLWRGWRADGWRVTSCRSSDRDVLVRGDVAIVTHRVATTLGDGTALSERETVVFDLAAQPKPVVLHEHLSA